MKSLIISLLTLFVADQAKQAAFAADPVDEDFSEASISSRLIVPSGYVSGEAAQPAGSIQNLVHLQPRVFVSTVAADYNSVDFVYEITATVRSGGPEEGAFIGIGGDTIAEPTAFPEPHSSIYFRLFPEGFGGTVDLSVSRDSSNWENAALSVPPHPGEGVYRVQIRKAGNSLTMACDADYTGGEFVPDYSVTRSMTQDLAFLTSSNSRLFFGVQGSQTTFDDLSIKVSRPVIPTLRVRAEIDGLSQLVIRPGRVFWNHLQAAIPGYGSLFTNAPTTLNGFEWFPKWPTPELCCSSAVSGVLTTHVAFARSPVGLSKQQGRGSASVIQQPTDENESTLIIQFDDLSSPGADWYELTLSGIAFSVPLTIEVTEVAIRWLSLRDYTYQIQYSELGASRGWRNFGIPIQGTGSNIVVFDNVQEERRAYRVLPILVE